MATGSLGPNLSHGVDIYGPQLTGYILAPTLILVSLFFYMSLDQNLFTLVFTQNKDYPDVVDLVDPSGTVHYHKRRVAGPEYKIEVYDPLSQAHLITASAPSASSKAKTLELHNPTILVDLKYTGTLSFRWSFKWEEHEFEWKRSECFLIRKPDPPVLVAITKEPTGRLRSHQVQILDYNINRFDVEDRKGLEIVLLTALMTFHDANEAYHEPSSQQPSVSRKSSAPMPVDADEPPPPPPPPKPAPKTGLDRIAELQAQGGDYNEVIVTDEGSVQDYAAYCNGLLEDDAMLFISVKSSSAQTVPKVLQVVEETKRIRYKAGLDEDNELHQYVLYDVEKKKGPRRINLDDDADQKAKYTPPDSLIVHLSKIDMPELQPKTQPPSNDKGKKNDKKVQPIQPTPFTSPPSIPPTPPSGSRPSSSSGQQKPQKSQKLQKNKQSRPAGDKDKKDKVPTPPPPPPPQPPAQSGTFNSYPSIGIFNTSAAPPPSSAASNPPKFPSPQGGGYETPGLSLYNSFVAHMQSPSGSHGSSFNRPPPPPSPAPPGHYPHYQPQPSGSSRPLSVSGVTGMATSVAHTVVSGLFDKLNQHRK
ncbi:hypothetical protein CC2G_011793 [Coprinopsis cinerea AmutBmut pab1-1]|nr:hypothetical protein CC2G_011793 [Coprinopsis cinerea AmutBmut pab1-1]